MTEFENKKFRLMALDEKQTDMIYQVFRQIMMGSSMYHMERVLGTDYASEIRKLIADLLEDDAPPEDSPIEECVQAVGRYQKMVYDLEWQNKELRAQVCKVLNQLHLEQRNTERVTIKNILRMIGSGDYSTGTWLAHGIAERYGISKQEASEWIAGVELNSFNKDRITNMEGDDDG